MTDRIWPVECAREWLLRKAAEFCAQERDEASWLAECAIEDDERHGAIAVSETRFRKFLGNNPDVFDADIDRAVADVYASAEPTIAPSMSGVLSDLLDAATFRTDHLWNGDCPEASRPDARDAECPACQAIVRAEEVLRVILQDQQKQLDIDALEVKAQETKALVAAATRGPWRWWTSNSMRRLSSDPSGKDGDVAHARIASDGVPDIAIREEDMAFIEGACNGAHAIVDAVLALTAEVRRLRSRVAELEER